MARFFKALAQITHQAGDLDDLSVNTWHFKSDGVGTVVQDITDIVLGLTGFYQAIDGQLSVNCTSPMTVKVYDHLEAPPRVPAEVNNISITAGTTALPNQLAVVLSLQAALVSGQPRGRRRGRLYIGPLTTDTVTDSTGDTDIPSAKRDVFGNAAGALLPEVPSTTNPSVITWCVFSESAALGLPVGAPHPSQEPDFTESQLTAGYFPIQRVRIHDRVGVQRRRRRDAFTFSDYT